MRIRTVKPEFWTHPVMARLPDFVKLLAIGLLNYADDHGYFIAEPAMIRGALFPMREDSREIREALAKLSELGFIECHEHPTHGPIGYLPKWKKHQKVDHPKASIYAELWQFAKSARESRENFAPDLGNKGTREQGIEGTRDDAEIIPIGGKNPPEPTAYQKIDPMIRGVLDGLTALLIESNQSKSRHWRVKQTMLAVWPVEFYDLMEANEMTCHELSTVLRWSQASDFWGPVIQSPADLAKNLDKITAQMLRGKPGSEAGSRKPAQGHVDKFPDSSAVM